MDFIFDPSLVLYLPLNKLEGASFMSRDAYGHLGTVTGALWRLQGHYFDGADDDIDCGADARLDFQNADFSIEVWLNPSVLNEENPIIRRYQAAGNNLYGLYVTTSGVIVVQCRDGLGNMISASYTLPAAGRWYHIVMTHDYSARTNYLYADGVQQASDTNSSFNNMDVSEITLYIGRQASNYFRGLIGETRIYSRVLTPLEIQHNYLATKRRYQ